MDALEQTTAIHALALSLAKELSREDATRLGLLLIQLGTTLETIVALEDLNSGASSQALTVGENRSLHVALLPGGVGLTCSGQSP